MDSLTQIVLGAAVGEASLGKKMGNKAILWGAIMGTIPDLDVISRWFLDTVDELHAHRAMTHSLLFFIVSAPIFAWLLKKLYRKLDISFSEWTNLCFLSLSTHALLDCFTTWGTQLFWPFSNYAVAWKTIFVIDPFYTLPFMAFVIGAMLMKRTNPKRWKVNMLGIVISTLYLGATVVNKQIFISEFNNSLDRQGIAYSRLDTRPGVINNFLWAATVESENEFLIGYRSLFDERAEVLYRPFPKNHHLLEPVKDHPKVQKLLQLFNGYYTVQSEEGKLIVNDLRFGQYAGWKENGGGFVFSYALYFSKEKPEELIIEARPRNEAAFGEMIPQLLERIQGI